MDNRIREIVENIKDMPFSGEDAGFDVPLDQYTTMKVGGPAEALFKPKTQDGCLVLLRELVKNGIHFFVLGGGSNLVIRDKGINGAVIGTHNLNSICLDEEKMELRCGSGVTVGAVIDFCLEHHLGGMEYFSGLPGTVGGASYMNARCYERNFSEYIKSVDYIDTEAEELSISRYEMDAADWDYKKSPFTGRKTLITGVILTGLRKLESQEEQKAFEEACAHYLEDRKNKGHFKCPSAGSVFKNNRSFGKPSGKLIDEAGLKGFSVGGAQIAPWHGNFIINRGNAKAKDIKDLVELVQKKVFENTGFLLEPEIIFV